MLKENVISALKDNLSILLKNAPEGNPPDESLANGLRALIDGLSMPLQVMIMGEFSVGKSTFINAMLKKEVAITSPIPTTAVITKFVYGSKDRIIVHFLNGKQKEYTPDAFNKLTVENNGKYKEMHDSIKYVERQLPNDLLKQYNFIDSPGRNVIVEKHEEVTRNFVENADAMLWLFSVDQMGGKTEKEILQSFSERLKPIAIVNKMDLVDDDDELEELIEELKLNFKDDIVDVVPISAEYALQGTLENQKDLLELSNIHSVYERLEHYLKEKKAYLKAKKMMQDFVPILDILEKKAIQIVRSTFLLDKENYERYINKLRETVQNYAGIGTALENIKQLCAEAISIKDLPESNENYLLICCVSDNWVDNCKKLIGSTLYFALLENIDSIYQCGNKKKKNEKWLEALYWYDICAERGYIDGSKKAGDICYYKLKKQLKAMKYYAKGWRCGDKYCRNMILKYLLKKGMQVFALYALLSIVVHGIGIHIYSARNEKIEADNHAFIQAKTYLDDMKSNYQNGIYRIKSENDEEVEKFKEKINSLKRIASNYQEENQKFHKSYDKYSNIDKYFLFSDYVIANYFTLTDSSITDQYNDDYNDTLKKMLDDEERIQTQKENALKLEKAEREKKEQQEKQKAEAQLSQNDIKDATRAFSAYHDALSNHNFDKAYDMLTSDRQNGMGTPGQMADGYRNTLESSVTDISCDHMDGNEAILNYSLKSRDRVDNSSRILVQYFKGQVHMFKNNGKWRIGYNESKKITEKYE